MGNRSNEEVFLLKAVIASFGITIMALMGNFIFTFWHEEIPSWVQYFGPLLGFFPFILLPILIVLYLIAVAGRHLASKIPEPKAFMDIHTKLALFEESVERIEKKVDNIEKILEKVSE